uniref:N-terminal acetyltransferase B complex subunit MDM20 homolog n=1 Tax=Meloidogyne hapla TaxID=6305 RepID=A0A1I8B2C7_MELHA
MQNNKNSAEQILARRLRPIYDAIDAGQYKKAILEADKVLKKHSQISGAHRTSEALNILRILETDLTDEEFNENTIQAVCHCYKELNSPERIVTLYSLLTKKYPKNEKLARELFFAHIRTKDFRHQQQIATQLYKDTNMPQYCCWAIMSILMQGYENKKLADLMLFPLAEKMLEKLPINDLCRMQGGIELRLIVLESRGRLSEAIEFIEVIQRQRLFTDIDKMRLRHKLNNLYRACGSSNSSIKCIEEDMNEWTNWVNLVDLIIAKVCSIKDQSQLVSSLNKHIEMWNDLMNECFEKVRHASELRGPLMGRLLFMDKIINSNILTIDQLIETKLGNPLNTLKELSDIVCDRPFGFADIKSFLHLLKDEEKKQLLDHISVITASV